MVTVNVKKFQTLRAEIHTRLVRITNREDPDQKQSDLGLCCLSKPFWHATSVQNFRTLP